MKLLTPIQASDLRGQELTRNILRAQEAEELLKTKNIRLAGAEKDFNAMLANQRVRWAIEEDAHTEWRKSAELEVKNLKEKKVQLLIPIELNKKRAETTLAEVRVLLFQAQEKEKHAEELQEALEARLDDIHDRESELKKSQNKYDSLVRGAEYQAQLTRHGAEELSRKMQEFYAKQAEGEASLVERKKEVSLREISLSAKHEKIKRDIEALRLYEIKLKDERATLDREYARKNHARTTTNTK